MEWAGSKSPALHWWYSSPRWTIPASRKAANIALKTQALRGLLDWVIYDPVFLDKLSSHKGVHLGPHKAQDLLQLSEIIVSSVVKLTGS